MQQLALFPEATTGRENIAHSAFSHGGVCPDKERQALEARYTALFEETDRFNRKLVSFQANKTEALHGWMKYREGFSADLVELLLAESGVGRGDAVLDPFAGSCTTLLEAKMLGVDATGVELLPHCHLAWEAKARVFAYDLDELRRLRTLIETSEPPDVGEPFPHLAITESAFPEETEREIMNYRRWFERLGLSEDARVLARLLLMSLLESVSYTRKDGQYLRWDERAAKVRRNAERRSANGNTPSAAIHKGPLPTVKQGLLEALTRIIHDVSRLQVDPPSPSRQELIAGNALFVLPQLLEGHFAGVITSPPYANRYDYTRTYALELAFLGVDASIFDLRQSLLSCTVENKPKLDKLAAHYEQLGQGERFRCIQAIVQANAALAEVNAALITRNRRGEINNRGVLTMIDQYFTELAFVFAELHRLCRRGACVAFVNDNVRYAGEIIPVDALSTNLAEQMGFLPQKIYVLPQRKGNSSQQMGKFGRQALRKSITIWRKPSLSWPRPR